MKSQRSEQRALEYFFHFTYCVYISVESRNDYLWLQTVFKGVSKITKHLPGLTQSNIFTVTVFESER